MKCRLCGQAPTGSDDLCADCSRALTRAREGGAALRQQPKAADRKRRAVDKITLRAPTLTPHSAQSRQRQFVTLALLGAVAVLLVYVGARGLADQEARDAALAEAQTRAAATQKLRNEIEAEMADSEPAEVTPAEPPEALPPPRPSPHPATGPRVARAPANAPATAASNASMNRIANDDVDPSAAKRNADAESSTRVARATLPQPAAAVDDGQSLSAALDKCSEEKFLAGVICEQKARLRYCEGKWGQVPQCTAKPHVE